LGKLFDMGILGTGGGGRGKLSDVENKVTVSAFCRRRLAVVMTRLGMADQVSAATKFIG
jgi:U3 small nucleolar ribonucleoprotein protein IMP3